MFFDIILIMKPYGMWCWCEENKDGVLYYLIHPHGIVNRYLCCQKDRWTDEEVKRTGGQMKRSLSVIYFY